MKIYRLTGILDSNGLAFNVTELNCTDKEKHIYIDGLGMNLLKRKIGMISDICEDPFSKRVFLLDEGQVPLFKEKIYNGLLSYIATREANINELKGALLTYNPA